MGGGVKNTHEVKLKKHARGPPARAPDEKDPRMNTVMPRLLIQVAVVGVDGQLAPWHSE